VSTATLASPRRIAWERRRTAAAEAWRGYRRNTLGMVGLVILVLVVLMAIAAPLLADAAGLHGVNTTQNPAWAKPSGDFALGTDHLGRPVLTQVIWGARISLLVGLAATVLAIVIGSVVGITAGFLGGRIDLITAELVEMSRSHGFTFSRPTAHGISGRYHLRRAPAAPGRPCSGDVITRHAEIASVSGRPSLTSVYKSVGPNNRASRSSTHSPPRIPTSQSCASVMRGRCVPDLPVSRRFTRRI